MKTICRCLALLTALCLLLFACCACSKEKDAGAAQGTYLSTDGEVPSVYQVPGGVFKYFYKVFLNTYADELQGTYGFDTARSAKEQSYNGETYYELIKRQVKEQLSRVWLLYADAREQGMTLTEAEQALLEQQVKASLQDRDITEEDIRQALQITFWRRNMRGVNMRKRRLTMRRCTRGWRKTRFRISITAAIVFRCFTAHLPTRQIRTG